MKGVEVIEQPGMFGMKKILVVDLEFYCSNANTLIIDRICELVSKQYQLTIATFTPKNSRSFVEHDRISILKLPYRSLNAQMNSASINLINRLEIIWYSIKARFKKDNVDEKNAIMYVRFLRRITDLSQFDAIISFSNPFSSHLAASIISEKYNIPWLAYYFDPFFSNATYEQENNKKRKKKEEKILSSATKVLMTYPTSKDYIERDVSFKQIIDNVEMPGVRLDWLSKQNVSSNSPIQCYFFGNLYKGIREPQNTIKLFMALKGSIVLNFVGGFYGATMEIKDIPGCIRFWGKKTTEELRILYDKSDILLNIGNSITNQMPSKIFEYISTGKPIINIYKDDGCPTLIYTTKYRLALNICEKDIVDNFEHVVNKVKTFCKNNIGKRISQYEINKLFFDNTDEAVSLHLSNSISQMLGEDIND